MPRRKNVLKFFTAESINTLIQEVKKRQCLWNTEHENYNDRTAIAWAWEEISEIMNMEEVEVRMKWKTIRDVFKREIRRTRVRNDIDEYTGKWRYFKDLWFLHKPNDLSNDDCEILVVSPDESPNIKFEPADYDDDPPSIDPLPEERPKQGDDDYDLMFLKSLTPFLRELEPIRKLVVRNKIQDMILNELAAQVSSRKYS